MRSVATPIMAYAMPFTAALTLFAAPAAAQTMNAEMFYQRAQALENKGMAAMLSPDLRPLMREMEGAGKVVRARRAAAEAKGQKLYCPPDKAKFGPREIVAALGAIPQAERQRMTITDAWQRVLVMRYPCRGAT